MINEFYKTYVLDAGGRYGLHPTWKSFTGELEYHLFEPDKVEASRLKNKYKKREKEIKIINKALSNNNIRLKLNLFKNRAMSSTAKRNPISSLFQTERKIETHIDKTIFVNTITIDNYCLVNKLQLDFIKLDTEGNEFNILQGSIQQLNKSILGVRSEVSFTNIYEGMPQFSAIHDLMIKNNFILLNFDYIGKGDYQNNFVNTNSRYGVLTSTDAVYVKDTKYLYDKTLSKNKNLVRILKYSAFCMCNNAPDLAINVLLKYKIYNIPDIKNTHIYNFLYKSLHKHFYDLKWQPGQSLYKHRYIFFKIFNRKMLKMNEYMESLELNPD